MTEKWDGVYWQQRNYQWAVRITDNGKRKHLGFYNEKEKAEKAYKKHRKRTPNLRRHPRPEK